MLYHPTQLCGMHIEGTHMIATHCMLRAMAIFTGLVAIPACLLSYVTEVCTLRAFRHYRMLEGAHAST